MFLAKYGYLILFIGETITIIGYLIRFLFFLIFPEAYQNFVKRHREITEEEAEELLKYLDQLRTDNTDHGNEEQTGTEENAKGGFQHFIPSPYRNRTEQFNAKKS